MTRKIQIEPAASAGSKRKRRKGDDARLRTRPEAAPTR